MYVKHNNKVQLQETIILSKDKDLLQCSIFLENI